MKVRVKELKPGDVFMQDGTPMWKVIDAPRVHPDGTVVCDVQFCADGGCESREWPNPDHTLEIEPGSDKHEKSRGPAC